MLNVLLFKCIRLHIYVGECMGDPEYLGFYTSTTQVADSNTSHNGASTIYECVLRKVRYRVKCIHYFLPTFHRKHISKLGL